MGQPVFRRDSVDYLPVSYARFRIFDGGYGQERPSWRTDSKPCDYSGGFPVRLCCFGGHLRR